MRKLIGATALVLSFGLAATAQLSVSVSMDPTPSGTAVTFTAEATIPTQLRTECPDEVRAGSPTGPIIDRPTFCSFLRPVLGPGQPFGGTSALFGWDTMDSSNNPAPPGQYFVKVQHRALNSTNPFSIHWVPVRVDPVAGPTDPVMAAAGPFTRGQTTGVSITSASQPGKGYAMFAALTTNTGFSTPFGHVALDQDPLFWASVFSAPIFSNLQGSLNAAGQGLGAISIPNIAALQGQSIAFQAVTIDGATIKLSNALSGIIQ